MASWELRNLVDGKTREINEIIDREEIFGEGWVVVSPEQKSEN